MNINDLINKIMVHERIETMEKYAEFVSEISEYLPLTKEIREEIKEERRKRKSEIAISNQNSLNKKLFKAAIEGNIDAVKEALDKGADIHATDWHGDTPLHDAARWERTEVVKLLIEKGADVNARNNFGQTPLETAVIDSKFKTCGLLARAAIQKRKRNG